MKSFSPAACTLLNDYALCFVPSDWESKAKTVTDLAQFELARLKKL